ANPDGEPDRFLGLYQPTGLVQRLEEGIVRELTLKSVLSTGSAAELEPRLRLAVINGREVA
ncbi:MAG TPA: PAS domain-containing protein, partial [Caulobacteraceae bacterium]|nr:PAS domain-containing protein [Caulobacteraceae bacterium]